MDMSLLSSVFYNVPKGHDYLRQNISQYSCVCRVINDLIEDIVLLNIVFISHSQCGCDHNNYGNILYREEN